MKPMIYFEINGKRVRPDQLADAAESAMLEMVADIMRQKIGSIRDPDTGEFPTIVMRGESIDDLHLVVEGSDQLIELVQARMNGDEEFDMVDEDNAAPETPKVFLSYTSDDRELAQTIATALQANGIDTWWDQWCISTGDSFVQKINEGLADCTHFLVLLTPQSIDMPWVKHEIDAALVRKINQQCRFLPLRNKLPVSQLPPLLASLNAPEINVDEDVTQLINDIYGVTLKPPLGPPPTIVAPTTQTQTGYSPAATALAKHYVETSKTGCTADPQPNRVTLQTEIGLTEDDLDDALFELSQFFEYPDDNHPFVRADLFAEFDRYFQPWDPREDAIKLAADIMNDPDFPAEAKKIAELYDWPPRRLNPAVVYLVERDIVPEDQMIGGDRGFEHQSVMGKPNELRRFLKSRQ